MNIRCSLLILQSHLSLNKSLDPPTNWNQNIIICYHHCLDFHHHPLHDISKLYYNVPG